MRIRCLFPFCLALTLMAAGSTRADTPIEISSIEELAHYAAQDGNQVRLAPGVYRMSDYLNGEILEDIRAEVAGRGGRPTVRMMAFSGSDNRFDLRGVTLEIETELYSDLPHGYVRCVFISGDNNTFEGLTIRNTGPNQGSNGNILAVFGEGNTLEGVTLYVHGSSPYGYGDLLGKGGPNLRTPDLPPCENVRCWLAYEVRGRQA